MGDHVGMETGNMSETQKRSHKHPNQGDGRWNDIIP